MPATYEPIATTTLGSANSAITFSSISSAYTDLRVVLVCQTASNANIAFRLNSNTGTTYSYTLLYGTGSAAASFRDTSTTRGYIIAADNAATSPNWNLCTMDIFSYTGSTNKTILTNGSNDKNGSGTVEVAVNLWRNTSAVNSVTLLAWNGINFNTGTTATLYGILRA